jgi:hypothetical protein
MVRSQAIVIASAPTTVKNERWIARTRWLLSALPLSALACAASGATAATGPEVVIAPVSTGTGLKEVAAPDAPDASPDAVDEEVRRLAKAAFGRTLDWTTVSRLEIHKQFPGAEKVRDALSKAGAPWSEDDWFGQDEPAPPARWEVAIGADVDVAAAQAVIAACVLEGNVAVALLPMTEDEDFGNRNRVYVGPLNASPGGPLPAAKLQKLLSPGVSKQTFYSLSPGKSGR